MHAYAHCNPQPSPCHCRLGGATPRSCCCKPRACLYAHVGLYAFRVATRTTRDATRTAIYK
jgi:hypothetical protein